jgi:hypothetical protein
VLIRKTPDFFSFSDWLALDTLGRVDLLGRRSVYKVEEIAVSSLLFDMTIDGDHPEA